MEPSYSSGEELGFYKSGAVMPEVHCGFASLSLGTLLMRRPCTHRPIDMVSSVVRPVVTGLRSSLAERVGSSSTISATDTGRHSKDVPDAPGALESVSPAVVP